MQHPAGHAFTKGRAVCTVGPDAAYMGTGSKPAALTPTIGPKTSWMHTQVYSCKGGQELAANKRQSKSPCTQRKRQACMPCRHAACRLPFLPPTFVDQRNRSSAQVACQLGTCPRRTWPPVRSITEAPSHIVCRPVGMPQGSNRPAAAAYRTCAHAATLFKPTGHPNMVVTALAGAIMAQLARRCCRPPA